MEAAVPAPSIGVALVRAYEWFDDALLARMHQLDCPEMTRSHSMLYSYLDPEGSQPAELARRIGISRQAVHKTLNEMTGLGLIELVPNPDDQRAKVVIPTERGREQIALARQVLAELERELEERIGSERMAGLRAALAVNWGAPPYTSPGQGDVLERS